MASKNEAGPSGELIKLDTADPAMDARSINKLFPKIDNLEHFPLKVLLNIFKRLDYMDLFNLAETSSRFEGIAEIVLNERYSREYFVVDETKHSQDTYEEFFKRFGNEIKAIEAKNWEIWDSNQHLKEVWWIESLLYGAKNLEKLILDQFSTKFLFESVNKHITHFTLRDCYHLPKPEILSRFQNLKKLELQNFAWIPFDSIALIIRGNPSLEGLILGENIYGSQTNVSSSYPFNRLMEVVGENLNLLKEFGYILRSRYLAQGIANDEPPDYIIDRFISSLKHLESLALSSYVDIFMDFKELLRRLHSECKSIKQLKLYAIDGDDGELFDIIQKFKNIESLTLSFTNFGDEIEFLVEYLPHLRELDIKMHIGNIDWSFVFVLLQKCSSLETLTVAGISKDSQLEMFGTSYFYNQFIESIQKPNVTMLVKFKDQIIGSISKNGVTWRNKRLRWLGCDQNSSNINLLDLAKKSQDAKGADRPSPFDLILGYLDLSSLNSLYWTSRKCVQLVGDYVMEYSQRHGTFTISNEFNDDFGGVEMFAEYVVSLRANIVHHNIDDLAYLFDILYNLNKLYIYAEVAVGPDNLIVPQVRHLIYDGPGFQNYSQLHELSLLCPDLETLELKQAVYDRFVEKEKERLEFCNLKRFTLKYHDDIKWQVENLQNIFKDTKTKLCLNI